VTDQRSVLIVDRSEESREVLQTALERRGMRIFATGRPQRGLEWTREHQPDLIVLDIEADNTGSADFVAPLLEQAHTTSTRLVLLGSVRRETSPATSDEFVAKPYHYAPLIRKIEALLSQSPSTSPQVD
jgi:DNA-binding response OmpR family regulator